MTMMRTGLFSVAVGAATIFSLNVVSVDAQESAPLAEDVFLNIQVLGGISADEFMDTMGMFSAATTKDCSGCHDGQIYAGVRDAFAITTPMIQRARGMVRMMNALNEQFFRGETRITCFTCHANTPIPGREPDLSFQYGTPRPDNPNSMEIYSLPGTPDDRVDQIFTKYIQALGGEEALAGVTSFVASGTYAGWDTAQSEVPLEIFAHAPNQYTTVTHRNEGDNVWPFDGQNAWYAGVDAAIADFTLTYTGGNLQGARIEAMVALEPAKIQGAFDRWRVGETLVDDQYVTVLQGSNTGESPVNFFFDETSGLLVRLVRWSETSVGPVPTQFDYADYREVDGVQRPFRWVKTWTNNQVTFRLDDMQPNVSVDPARFARPDPIQVR